MQCSLYTSCFQIPLFNTILFVYSRGEPVTEEDLDHEEEFYYAEVEVPLSTSLLDLATPPSPSSPTATTSNVLPNINCQFISNPIQVTSFLPNGTIGSNSTVTLPLAISKTNSNLNGLPVLSDHMDMARPPHENPEYVHHQQIITRPISQTQQQQRPQQQQPRRLNASTNAINAGPSRILIPQSHMQQQQLHQQPIFQTAPQSISAASANALPIAIPVTSFALTATNATVSVRYRIYRCIQILQNDL